MLTKSGPYGRKTVSRSLTRWGAVVPISRSLSACMRYRDKLPNAQHIFPS